MGMVLSLNGRDHCGYGFKSRLGTKRAILIEAGVMAKISEQRRRQRSVEHWIRLVLSIRMTEKKLVVRSDRSLHLNRSSSCGWIVRDLTLQVI